MPLAMMDDLLNMSTCGQESLSLNIYMNTQIELKKLKFHTPNKDGKSKCHKIHVGPKNKLCPKLQVHGTQMEEVDYDTYVTYVGDVVSGDGKNTENVKKKNIQRIRHNFGHNEHFGNCNISHLGNIIFQQLYSSGKASSLMVSWLMQKCGMASQRLK